MGHAESGTRAILVYRWTTFLKQQDEVVVFLLQKLKYFPMLHGYNMHTLGNVKSLRELNEQYIEMQPKMSRSDLKHYSVSVLSYCHT